MNKYMAFAILTAALLGCRSNHVKKSNPTQTETEPGSGEASSSGRGGGESSSAGLNLVWKRYRAFEAGLMQGLALAKDDLCKEIGKHSCIDKVHLSVLGGNEPYQLGQYERPQSPSALTGLAVDRIVLSACKKRIDLDKAAGSNAVVFKYFPLTGAAASTDQLQKQAGELYRRLLARDPEAAELAAVSGFAGKILQPEKAALGLCIAIGTSAENILL